MPGYSGTPLASKLGIKPGYSLLVVGAPSGYRGLLHPLPEGVVFTRKASERTDLVHFFSASKSDLSTALKQYRARLKPSSAVWVSWPKKSSKVATDITEDTVREVALPLGFVDVKVCAVTEVWSGLKLVVRKELRSVSSPLSSPPDRFRVLFLCTHNAARSQIAEAVLRRRAGDRFEVVSAGSQPGGSVHPLAMRIIKEIGGDQTLHRPKGFEEVLEREWDLVVTVCDQALEACPVIPSRTVSAHWGMADPGRAQGSEEQRMAAFRIAHKLLTERIDLFLSLGPEKIEPSVLKDRLTRIAAEVEGLDD